VDLVNRGLSPLPQGPDRGQPLNQWVVGPATSTYILDTRTKVCLCETEHLNRGSDPLRHCSGGMHHCHSHRPCYKPSDPEHIFFLYAGAAFRSSMTASPKVCIPSLPAQAYGSRSTPNLCLSPC
jgi:hypothetical protein